MVDRSTQTYVTQVKKQTGHGCINCRSREHGFRECLLPYRPGFCTICGADGFDTLDCIFPHGIEHEIALGRCPGCSREEYLYCPECPDCNIRHAGLIDYLRLNYATWPSFLIPKDHRYLVDNTVDDLKRRIKAKFNDKDDLPIRIRKFLIRENALMSVDKSAKINVSSPLQLSEEKRQRAVKALLEPQTKETMDEVMRKRPELRGDEEIRVIVPTKFKNILS